MAHNGDLPHRPRPAPLGPPPPRGVRRSLASGTDGQSPAADADPEAHAELAESLTLGFLTMLESLAPLERVVFVLADVYEVPFTDIATMVDKSADACRQVASRARRRVREGRPRLDPPADASKVVADLLLAVATADIDKVTSLLAPDVVLVSDGGAHRLRRPPAGHRSRARRSLHGEPRQEDRRRMASKPPS